MALTDASIIILTKNAGELFMDVFSGLFACEGVGDAEVLVIDSGSTDRTLEYARRYPQVRIHEIPPSEFGHGRTRNLGARLATRATLVYLVQDATPAAPDFLTKLIAPLGEGNVAGVYGRQLPRPWTNKCEELLLRHTYPDRPERRAYAGSGPLGIRDMFFSNVCSAIRRDVWERIPFDESLIMSEDQQWAKHALLAGHQLVYEPRAAVLHSHNYRLKEVFKRNFDSGVSLVGVAETRLASTLGDEIRYLLSGVKDLSRGGVLTIPYFLAYETTRAAAFAAGQHAHLLPRHLKRTLSLHKYHWAPDRVPSRPQ